jgi:hypothetical protein
MLAEMETMLRRFRPAWLDIFMLTPTEAYVDSHFGGSWDAFWAHIGPFEAIVPPALPDLAARTGYEVRMGRGHHMMLKRIAEPKPESTSEPETFQYFYTALTSVAHRPLNVLGLGRSARSLIFGTAAFAAHDPNDSPWAEGPAGYIGNAIDVADEARSFLGTAARSGQSVARVPGDFGSDMTEVLDGWARGEAGYGAPREGSCASRRRTARAHSQYSAGSGGDDRVRSGPLRPARSHRRAWSG